MFLTKRLKFQILFLILAIVIFLNAAFVSPAPVAANLPLEESKFDAILTSIGQNLPFVSIVEASSILIGKVIVNYKSLFTQDRHEPFNRILIKGIIDLDPGITLREIKRETSLAMGVIQYHLNFLDGKDIESLKLGRTKHFFSITSDFTHEEKTILSLQRNPTIKCILGLLNKQNGFITQKELVSETGKSRALISYYIKSLKAYGIIESAPDRLGLFGSQPGCQHPIPPNTSSFYHLEKQSFRKIIDGHLPKSIKGIITTRPESQFLCIREFLESISPIPHHPSHWMGVPPYYNPIGKRQRRELGNLGL